MSNPAPAAQHWLLWDGACGFCRECARWVQEHDSKSKFIVIAYQDAPSPPMSDSLRARCRDSVHVLSQDGTMYSGGGAFAFVLEAVGYRRLGRLMRSRVIRPLIEWGYRRVANNRELVGRLVFGKRCAK